MRGVVAGLVVVALAAACIVVFMGKGEKPVEKKVETKPAKIKEVKPAVHTNVAPVKRELTQAERNLHDIQLLEQKYGTNLTPSLKAYIRTLKNPPKRKFHPIERFPYLQHPAERDIASLLMTEPGCYFVIQPEYGESFNQDFVNSLLDKIEIEKDDTEEVRAVKNFVTAAKKDLAALVRESGKKPSELMNEHAAEMYELGHMQQMLEEELIAARRNADMSDEDVKDLFMAANELRKKRGLPERPIPDLTKRALRLKRQQERAALDSAERESTENK